MKKSKQVFNEIINSVGREKYIEACKIVEKQKEYQNRIIYVGQKTYDLLTKLK